MKDHVTVTEGQEKESGTEKYLKIAENFPNLTKDISLRFRKLSKFQVV